MLTVTTRPLSTQTYPSLVGAQSGREHARWQIWLPPLLVLVVATALGVVLCQRYIKNERFEWGGTAGDSHAHLCHGLWLADDVRHGRLRAVISDLDKCRVWPPLHDGILVGAVMLATDLDERWAILPSLVGWIGTVVLAFLVARRALTDFRPHAVGPAWSSHRPGIAGQLAGAIAAMLVLASPMMRGYATEVMLESIGACLTLAVFYFFQRAVQDGAPWRWFALALTLLFLHKYNYWGLVTIALAMNVVLREPRAWLRRAGAALAAFRAAWLRELLHPLSWVAGLVLGLSIFLGVSGPVKLAPFGKEFALSLGPNFITVVYVVLFLRFLAWYQKTGRGLVQNATPALRQIMMWHVWPLLLWFLWPNRLYYFMWYSNPATNSGEVSHFDLFGGYAYYWHSMIAEYHVAVWSAVLVLILLAVAAVAGLGRKLRPGVAPVLLLVLVAFLLVCHHPNRKGRFLHSWIPAQWVGSGVGAGCLIGAAGHRRWLRGGCVAIGSAVLAVHVGGLVRTAPTAEGAGWYPDISILDVTDSYLPDLNESNRVAVFSNLPMTDLAQWTYTQRYHRATRLETDVKDLSPSSPDSLHQFETWAEVHAIDTIVWVEYLPQSPFYGNDIASDELAQYGRLLSQQHILTQMARRELPRQRCVVTVWKAKGGTP